MTYPINLPSTCAVCRWIIQEVGRIRSYQQGRLIFSSLLIMMLVACGSQTDPRPNILFVISDDQSWIHTSFHGENEVRTPHFDRIAREGAYFTHAYVSAPSCTASRSAILAGQAFWRLRGGAVLWGKFSQQSSNYQKILAAAGYVTGYTGKGWGPGDMSDGDPVGSPYNRISLNHGNRALSEYDYGQNFSAFLDDNKEGKPFSFWLSPYEPHRPYAGTMSAGSQINQENINIPSFLPDRPEVRQDLANYYDEISWFDQALGAAIAELEARDMLDNTIIVVTSDNGMPFPRAKANNYDFGVRVPLAIRWPDRISSGQTVSALVNLSDLAPTFLNIANVPIPEDMQGRSLWPLLANRTEQNLQPSTLDAPVQEAVLSEQFRYTFTGFERHVFNARGDGLGYSSRAIHSREFLLIKNFSSERWPAGSPPQYRDIDSSSPSKIHLLNDERLLDLATGKRPELELYKKDNDPYQTNNLAEHPAYIEKRQELHALLMSELEASADPILVSGTGSFESYPYFGTVNP